MHGLRIHARKEKTRITRIDFKEIPLDDKPFRLSHSLRFFYVAAQQCLEMIRKIGSCGILLKKHGIERNLVEIMKKEREIAQKFSTHIFLDGIQKDHSEFFEMAYIMMFLLYEFLCHFGPFGTEHFDFDVTLFEIFRGKTAVCFFEGFVHPLLRFNKSESAEYFRYIVARKHFFHRGVSEECKKFFRFAFFENLGAK